MSATHGTSCARRAAWSALPCALACAPAGVGAATVGCSGDPSAAEGPARSLALPLDQCATSGAIQGIDVYDGQGTIDWRAVAGDGVAFAFMKATQGTYDTQATFARNWSCARDAGIARGAYHFFDPTEDGTAQALHYLSVVGAFEPDDLAPMLDIECPDGDPSCLYAGSSGEARSADIAARMWGFLRAVEAATARRPIVYTFESYFATNDVDAAGLDAYPLFVAYPSSAACFPVPAPWSRAALWQYSWSGRVQGIGATVDRDVFLSDWGTLHELDGAPGANMEAGTEGGSGGRGESGGVTSAQADGSPSVGPRPSGPSPWPSGACSMASMAGMASMTATRSPSQAPPRSGPGIAAAWAVGGPCWILLRRRRRRLPGGGAAC